jgi:hypothetical protein
MTTAQTTPAAADPRPLAVQFTRTFPDRPCCLTSEEMSQFAMSQPGGYAPWHVALLAVRATWGLDEATAAKSA